MNKALSRDMTSGSEAGHIIRFALPMLAGNLLQQLYNLADTAVVGKYVGDDAIAAVGATGSITFFFYNLCTGLAVGSGVILSQYFGAEKTDKLKSAVFNSAVITAIFGIAVSLISVLLTKPTLILMDTPKKLIDAAAGYMRIACGGTIAVAAYNWINAVMRSLGDSKTPLIFLAIASALNIGLDLLFVVVFGWGIDGAAAATVVAQTCSAVGCIIYGFSKNDIIKLSRENLKINSAMIKQCVKTGVPICLQNGLISVSMIALQRVTNSFGETIMTSYTVSMRIEQLIQQPFSSLNAAVSTFIGQNTGSGKSERVKNGYKTGMLIAVITAVTVSALFFLFARALAGCFVNSGETAEICSNAIKLNSCFYIFLGTIHVTRGFLNGAGDTSYALINGAAEVVCRIVFSLILTSIPFIGYWGIWLTTCVTWFITALVSFIRYKSGKWRGKAIV